MSLRPTALLRTLAYAGALLLLAACNFFSGPEDKKKPEGRTHSQEEAMAEMGSRFIEGLATDPTAQKLTVTSSEELARIDNGVEEELIWTDPDNPDAANPELDAIFENKRKGNGWINDLDKGMRFARREGRPLILWIHDSVISPKSKQLAKDLLETEKFLKWCEDRVVCVKLDAGSAIDEHATGKRISLSTVQALQRRFGVSKRPALVVISPQGKVMERVDGYNGYPTEVELALRNGVILANDSNEAFRKKLQAKGFRDWRFKRGGKVFAKLQRMDEKKNLIYLKEAGGKISRIKISRFSQEDVEYLDELSRSGQAPH